MVFFFLNDTATTEIYPLSLHDALPIYAEADGEAEAGPAEVAPRREEGLEDARQHLGRDPIAGVGHAGGRPPVDRKSTRLNSSHANISYAVFCLKKKKTMRLPQHYLGAV